MTKSILLLLALTAVCSGSVITPDSFGGPFCLSPPFGPAACALNDEYKGGGLLFSHGGVGTAVFRDPPHAWGGINALGLVDLIAPVDGAIVVAGTTAPGVTGYIAVEAGYAHEGSLLLTVYGVGGEVLATRLSGLDGTGPNGRHLMIINIAGIRSFSVSTPLSDTFGVNQIELGDITPVDDVVIPEPGTLLLLGSGLALMVFRRLLK